MEIESYLRAIKEGWIALVITLLVVITGVAAYTFIQQPTYTTTAEVYMSVRESSTVQDAVQGATLSQELAQNYAQIATSSLVLKPVAAQLGIKIGWSELARAVESTADANSAIVRISVTQPSPADSARIANAIADRLSQESARLDRATDDASVVRLTNIQPAEAALAVSSPNVRLNLLLGAAVGLVLGFLAATVTSLVKRAGRRIAR